MRKEFWKDWKRKTKKEEIAIESIKKVKQILFRTIPRDKIFAIYIKGSFVRREMNKKSDVDIVPITYSNKTLDKIKNIQETKGNLYKPSELLPHSLQEFKSGKRYLKYDAPKSNVDVTLRNLFNYKLIYGKPVDISKYPMRSDIKFLKDHIKAFRKIFFPLYKSKKFGFSYLVKQTFFLIEREERVKGLNPSYSWKKLTCSIKDKNHIIHSVLQYRLHPSKDKKVRSKLLKKIKKYLKQIERKYN